MDETTALLIDSVEHRRRLAGAKRDALKADAFDRPAEPADIALWEAEIVACDTELEELRRGNGGNGWTADIGD